jgi:hypothetical protein
VTQARADYRFALGALDFKSGVALIEVGYRYAADTLANSKLADCFVT